MRVPAVYRLSGGTAASERSMHDWQHRRALGGCAVLVAAAWLALALIHYSPYARYFTHEVLGESAFSPPAAVALFTGGWLIMIVAMMVPGVMPVLAHSLRGGAVGHWATWLAGNVSPWLLLGFAFAAADLVIHSQVAPRYPLLAARLPSLLWLAAGAQLVLVSAALNRVDAPHTRAGMTTHRSAFLRGWRTGLADLGAGWLMMLAVAGSHGHLAVMAAVTVLMSAPSYRPVPRWSSVTAGASLALLGARLLLAVA